MSTIPSVKELFKAGAHYGHRRNRTDARAHKFVFTYRNKVAVIDLEKTREGLEKALEFLAEQAKEGATVLFVGTKVQAKETVRQLAESLKQPYIVERWPGGLLTNYEEVSKAIKRMLKTETDLAENKFDSLTKKERLMIEKDLKKKQNIFGGLRYLSKKPDIVIVVDAKEEEIAVAEANISGAKVIGICDTNANPRNIDYPIPANDDSKKALEMILALIADAISKNFKSKVIPTEAEVTKRVEKAIKKENAGVAPTEEEIAAVDKPIKVEAGKDKPKKGIGDGKNKKAKK